MEGNYINEQGSTNDYSVDIVFCIDATRSMVNLIEKVKENTLKFYDDFRESVERISGKKVRSLRVRAIVFRDYLADGEKAMLATDFFELPGQNEEFKRCIQKIQADGGGDIPEDGLEALAYAIRSDWNKSAVKSRQVIVIWTDAPAHDIGYGKASTYYPKNMPSSMAELSEWWGDSQLPSEYINEHAKRLAIFAPDAEPWNSISNNWNQVVMYPAKAGEGLDEITYEQILDLIARTMAK